MIREWFGDSGPERVSADPLSAPSFRRKFGDLEDIADTCFVLDGGRLTAEGRPGDILADMELLERTNLIHAHRHRHGSGELHSHPHVHRDAG